MWGYLGEFWNAITSVGDYTVEFFQSIGNAVAGAIGSLFDFFIHTFSDIVVYAGWFFENIGHIFALLFSPINYIFNFLKSFILSAVSTPPVNTTWVFTDQIKEIFNAIPLWNSVVVVLGACVLILTGVSLLRHLSHN
jgi:phage-related protein